MNLDELKLEDLQLIHFADTRITTRPPAFDFEKDGPHAEKLGKLLYEKMKELKGVGLSANQVGLPYRVFVFGNEERYIAMFNPQVMGVSKETSTMSEGCLSFPEFFLTLKRPERVLINYQNEKGEFVSSEYVGIGARIILHEYDHMEGMNFTQHASTFKMKWELKKWKKKQQKLLRKLGYVNK
jgi:peptide deformylase